MTHDISVIENVREINFLDQICKLYNASPIENKYINQQQNNDLIIATISYDLQNLI